MFLGQEVIATPIAASVSLFMAIPFSNRCSRACMLSATVYATICPHILVSPSGSTIILVEVTKDELPYWREPHSLGMSHKFRVS